MSLLIVDFSESVGYVPRYTYEQTEPSTVWVVEHNLDAYPSITIVDDNRCVMHGEVVYTDRNTITVTFNEAVTGYAYC